MDLFTACHKRRSCRKYLAKPVEFEKLTMLIDSASCAPSAGNLQQWKFIIITERDTIKRIANFCFQQPWIATAPTMIAVCSICEKQEQYYGKRGKSLYSIQSVAAAIQNMLLTATALELGTCWVGGFDEGRVKDILQVPSNVNLHALLPIGYPDEVPDKKTMFPLESRVYFNVYGMPIKNWDKFMKDFSLVIEKEVKEKKPQVEQLLDKIKQMTKDMTKKKK